MIDQYNEELYKRITLDGIHYGIGGQVSAMQMVTSKAPQMFFRNLGYKLGVDLRYLFAGKRAKKTIKLEVKHPATWWDAFKLQYFPKRWRRVNYRVVSQEYAVDGYQFFPDVPIELGQMCVQVDVWERGRNLFLVPEEE